MDQTTLDKLQYEDLKKLVKEYCVSDYGRRLVDELTPSSDIQTVKKTLTETNEARLILETGKTIPFIGSANIKTMLTKLNQSTVFQPDELIEMADFLRGCRKIRALITAEKTLAPKLVAMIEQMASYPEIESKLYDDIRNHQVDSSASGKLRKVRRHLEMTEQKIKDQLSRFLSASGNQRYIQDAVISLKDDRFAIPIKANYKNQVSGSIVGSSAKGTTVFIEPAAVGKLSSERDQLRGEESVIVYQILAKLTNLVAEKQTQISQNIRIIGELDFIFAKGKYSKAINGITPALNTEDRIKLVQCPHPLLSADAVPLDFTIGDRYRSLIITGPNAGGKTVTLKTVGLVTLAVMSGFQIRAEKGTTIAIFNNVFADIGDDQSLTNALSTFSSHIRNLSNILEHTGTRTLLLLDEIGSGTEPNEGAAIAITLLQAYYKKGAITIATTHYGEIKDYAQNHPDFINAAMQFDVKNLRPLYQLVIGESGDSNAFWIAHKMAIPENLIAQAKGYLRHEPYDYTKIAPELLPVHHEAKAAKNNALAKGDRVLFNGGTLEGLVYRIDQGTDKVVVYSSGKMLTMPGKQLKLKMAASELYPEGYDLNQLFR